jgi:hypothetical protein
MTRTIYALIITLFFALLIFGSVGLTKNSSYAYIQEVSGPVWIERLNWLYPAEKAAPLMVNDQVKTGLQGSATIRFLQRHLVKLGPDTSFKITKLDTKEKREFILLNLDIGTIFVEVRKRFLTLIDFKVETPAAIAGVRGTKFQLSVNNQGQTELTVDEGTVLFTSKADGSQISVVKGQSAVINPGSKPEYRNKNTDENRQSGKNHRSPAGTLANGQSTNSNPSSDNSQGQGGKGI